MRFEVVIFRSSATPSGRPSATRTGECCLRAVERLRRFDEDLQFLSPHRIIYFQVERSVTVDWNARAGSQHFIGSMRKADGGACTRISPPASGVCETLSALSIEGRGSR